MLRVGSKRSARAAVGGRRVADDQAAGLVRVAGPGMGLDGVAEHVAGSASAGPGWARRDGSGLGHHQLTPPSSASSMSSKFVVNVPADRYFQPPSGRSATIVPDVHRRGLAGRGDQDRPARRAGEDALAEHQLAQRGDRVAVRDEVLRVDQRRVEDLRDEALVERAEALDLLAGQWLGGHDPHARLVLAQVARHAHQRAARPEPGDEDVDLGAVGEDLRTGRLVVGLRDWPGCRTGRA